MNKIVTGTLFILIFLFSCSDVSDFLFETEQNIQIRSINNGSVYQGGDSLPLTFSFDREIIPEEFTVTIFDDLGTSWGETTIDIPLVEDEFPTSLIVPEQLPQGKYIFHIRVFENDQEISFKEIIIFKTESDYRIEQLYSLPHQTNSGKQVLIKAVVDSPFDEDPFLRWSTGETLLNEGYLSDGLDSLNWISEDENGLYTIKLEVFPESCDSTFQSNIYDTTEIIVSDQIIIETNSLAPDDVYSLLFHFSGDFLPTDENNFDVVNYGEINSESISNILGYSLSVNTGLKAVGPALPTISDEITSFSISGRAVIADEINSGNVISISDSDNSILSLNINSSGFLELSINEVVSTSLFSLFDITDFTISVIPLEEQIEIRWYFNGINGGFDILETEFVSINGEQICIIGGSETITGSSIFLDELGIFVGNPEHSTIDGEQFYRVKKYLLGENLIAADGYDGMDDGLLEINPGQEILLGSFVKSVKDTEFVLSIPEPESGESDDKWALVLRDEFGSELFSLNSDDAIHEMDIKTGLTSQKIRFSLLTDEELVEINVKNNELKNRELTDLHPGDMISLFFETNVENSNKSYIDFFIIYANFDNQIPEKIATYQEEEKFL